MGIKDLHVAYHSSEFLAIDIIYEDDHRILQFHLQRSDNWKAQNIAILHQNKKTIMSLEFSPDQMEIIQDYIENHPKTRLLLLF